MSAATPQPSGESFAGAAGRAADSQLLMDRFLPSFDLAVVGYLLYGLLLPTWFILTGWTLHTVARQPRIASQPRTDDPARDHARPGDTTEG
jgi:hypothetical protein